MIEIFSSNFQVIQGNIEPIIIGKLFLVGGKWTNDLQFILDTGYSGDLFLNKNSFNNFFKNLVPDIEISNTLTGQIKLNTINAIFKINEYEIDIVLQSPVDDDDDDGSNLIGFNFLINFLTKIDGPNSSLSLSK